MEKFSFASLGVNTEVKLTSDWPLFIGLTLLHSGYLNILSFDVLLFFSLALLMVNTRNSDWYSIASDNDTVSTPSNNDTVEYVAIK
jgi:inner membrane protein involved in colicin E2 resistance